MPASSDPPATAPDKPPPAGPPDPRGFGCDRATCDATYWAAMRGASRPMRLAPAAVRPVAA